MTMTEAHDPLPERLPNFFILGAPKCGTTSLYLLLASHPEIFMTRVKEVNFFNRDALYAKGLDYYVDAYFAGAEAFALRGEGSPSYFNHPESVGRRLQAAYRGRPPKFLILLREPVARAISHHHHRHRMGRDLEPSFERALALESNGGDGQSRYYYSGGLYATLLKEWFKLFPRDCFRVHLMEELIEQEGMVRSDVLAFLGASTGVEGIEKLPRANASDVARNGNLFRLFQHIRTSRSLGARTTKELLKRIIPRGYHSTVKNSVYQAIQHSSTKGATVDPDTRQRLRALYRPEIEELQTLLGKDLSRWLNP